MGGVAENRRERCLTPIQMLHSDVILIFFLLLLPGLGMGSMLHHCRLQLQRAL